MKKRTLEKEPTKKAPLNHEQMQLIVYTVLIVIFILICFALQPANMASLIGA